MSNQYGPRIVTNGLVLCLDAGNNKSYPGTGTTWFDLSGNNNNGTLTNGPTYSSANKGSILFDGSNDYTILTRPPSLANGGSITVSLWAKWLTTGTTISSIKVLLDNNHSASPVQGFVLQDRPDLSKSLTFSVIPNIAGAQTTFQVGDNTWRYIVGTNDLTNTKLYIDGKLNSQVTQAGGLVVVQPNISLGYWQFTPSRYLSGNIGSVYIYSRALTANEILQNYNATKGRFNL